MMQYNAEISTYEDKNVYFANSINSLKLIIKIPAPKLGMLTIR